MNLRCSSRFAFAAAFAAAVVAAPPLFALAEEPEADAWSPQRPVRIVVYTGPGGLIDFTARKFAEVARKYEPTQPIVVINKPGAGGVVAFEDVLQQPADGHTLLAVTRSNISKLVSVGRDDLIDGVEWTAYVMDNPHVVITNRNSGLDTWGRIAANAAEREGRQLWLGVDIGGVKHVSGLRVWDATGIEARWIPFGSGGQASAALLGEVGQVYFGNPGDASRNPSLAVVAVCAKERLAAFPDSPTFRELGIEGLEDELIWRGFAYRKGTPEPVLRWFDRLAKQVHADEEWRSQWEHEGINVLYKGREDFHAVVEKDRAVFAEYLAPLGLLKGADDRIWFGGIRPDTAVRIGNVLLVLLFGGFVVGALREGRTRRLGLVGELAVSAGAAITAVSLLLMSTLLPGANAIDRVGAAGVPRLWSVALLAFAGTQLFLSIRRLRGSAAEDGLGASGDGGGGVFFGIFLLATLAYLFLIQICGYLLASCLFLPAVCWFLGFRKWLPIAAMTVCWLCFAYFVFEKTLYVDLPSGWLLGRTW